MTVDQFILKQKKVFDQIIKKDIPLQRAAQSTAAKQATRIFVEGKNSAGGNIGQYDTTHELYINPNKAPRKGALKAKGIEGLLPTMGKTGKTHFADGKPHKTTYLKNYKEGRSRMGKRIDKVNLDYSGDLKSDFSNKAEKVNDHEYVTGLKRKINIDKKEGLEAKYGNIFLPTAAEKKNFFDIVQKEFNLIIANA